MQLCNRSFETVDVAVPLLNVRERRLGRGVARLLQNLLREDLLL